MDWYRYKISEILKKFNVSENKGICKSISEKKKCLFLKLYRKNRHFFSIERACYGTSDFDKI